MTKIKEKLAAAVAKTAAERPALASAAGALGFANPGFGLGLRTVHYDYILEHLPKVDWFEIISENFMDTRGRPRQWLDRVAAHYPIVMHGVSMNIGSTAPLDMRYLRRLREFRDEIKALWVSDHLCWTGVKGQNTHQLLPTPYTEEVLKLTVKRIRQVQDVLEARLVLENPSSYFEYTQSSMHEADFLRHMAEEADCGLLLDVNNVYVSAFNHEFDAADYVARIPHGRVVQYHLAGHTRFETHILDTHSDHVIPEVWKLFEMSWRKKVGAGADGAAVMVEWDEDIPEFPVLMAELAKARKLCGKVLGKGADVGRGDGGRAGCAAVGMTGAARRIAAPKLYGWVQRGIETWADDSDPAIGREIQPNSRLTAAGRFEIYSRDYYGRLREVLAQDYEIVAAAVGPKRWMEVADGFILRWPSRGPNLNEWGKEFADYLREETQLPSRAALSELAKLERAVSMAPLLDDSVPALAADALSKLTPAGWASLRLVVRPSIQLVELAYPVNAVMRKFYAAAHEQEAGGVSSASGGGHAHGVAAKGARGRKISLPRKPTKQWVQVYRKGEKNWRMELPAARAALLRALTDGKALGAALTAAQRAATADGGDKNLAAHIQEWFADWMADGVFAANARK